MVDFIVRVANAVLVDPRIKPDIVVTVLGHVMRWVLWVLQLPVLIVGGLFEGPRMWQGINTLNLKIKKQKTMAILWQFINSVCRETEGHHLLVIYYPGPGVCVCVCVCMCVCVCACTCTCVRVCGCMAACSCVVCLSVCLCMCVCVLAVCAFMCDRLQDY